MEQTSQLSGNRIKPRDVWAFVIVAVKTCECKVFRSRWAIVLFCDHVVHFVSCFSELLRHLAILAAGRRAKPYPITNFSIQPAWRLSVTPISEDRAQIYATDYTCLRMPAILERI